VSKQELRKSIKHKLSKLSDLEKKSRLISQHLKQLLSELNSNHLNSGLLIGGFSPIQKEPTWLCAFEEEDCFEYSLVHMHDDIRLTFHPINKQKIFSESFDLKLSEELLNKEVTPDVLLIPGLAFTSKFDRLGRGKGYFDSYLKNFSGKKIGLCFEDQIVKSVYPEEHDEKLDYLITEKKIYIRG
jgi:5-formyltetrahydrofolate cyclo-ligase